jgi:hypothetical protein
MAACPGIGETSPSILPVNTARQYCRIYDRIYDRICDLRRSPYQEKSSLQAQGNWFTECLPFSQMMIYVPGSKQEMRSVGEVNKIISSDLPDNFWSIEHKLSGKYGK